MTLRRIVRMGHPVLRQRAAEVRDPTAPEIRALAAEMLQIMEQANGVGLAAPQVAVPARLIVYSVPASRSSGEADDAPAAPQVLVDPVLTPLEPELQAGWEGCLSIPGLRGLVPRHAVLRVTGWDTEGRAVDRVARGFNARVLQHEVDHLDGILYLDRMPDMGSLAFDEELQALAAEREAEEAALRTG